MNPFLAAMEEEEPLLHGKQQHVPQRMRKARPATSANIAAGERAELFETFCVGRAPQQQPQQQEEETDGRLYGTDRTDTRSHRSTAEERKQHAPRRGVGTSPISRFT